MLTVVSQSIMLPPASLTDLEHLPATSQKRQQRMMPGLNTINHTLHILLQPKYFYY